MFQGIRKLLPGHFLTARGDQADVLTGLRAGGDDYLAKPFSIEELLLRIWAVLRRSRRSDAPISVGPLVINPAIHEATLVGRALDLTPLEFRLLAYLARASERVVPVPELVAEVWGVVDFGAHDPLVKSTVYRLRHKLGDQSDRPGVDLRNVRGVGYQLRPVS